MLCLLVNMPSQSVERLLRSMNKYMAMRTRSIPYHYQIQTQLEILMHSNKKSVFSLTVVLQRYYFKRMWQHEKSCLIFHLHLFQFPTQKTLLPLHLNPNRHPPLKHLSFVAQLRSLQIKAAMVQLSSILNCHLNLIYTKFSTSNLPCGSLTHLSHLAL